MMGLKVIGMCPYSYHNVFWKERSMDQAVNHKHSYIFTCCHFCICIIIVVGGMITKSHNHNYNYNAVVGKHG